MFASEVSASQSATNSIPTDGWVAEYRRFYQEVFGLTVDFSAVEIPTDIPGFGWVVILAQDLTLNRAWTECDERFPSWSAYLRVDLDNVVLFNDRNTTMAYAKRFRDCIEADEENKELSANDLVRLETQNITLLERLVLELWYHWKSSGAHLDIKNVTLCAGSRFKGGFVPSAGWRNGTFEVDDLDPDCAYDHYRSRSAV